MSNEYRYGTLRAFAVLHVILAVVVAFAGLIGVWFGIDTSTPTGIAAGIGLFFVAVALVATSQMFQVLMDTEQNTRRIAELLAQRTPPTP